MWKVTLKFLLSALILSSCTVKPPPTTNKVATVETAFATSTLRIALEPGNTPITNALTPTEFSTQILAGTDEGTVLMIFGQNFDYRQYEGIRTAFERADYKVLIASNTLEPLEGVYVQHGFENTLPFSGELPKLSADLLLDDIQIAGIEAIILVSDEGLLSSKNQEVKRILQEAFQEGKVIAANDTAVLLLGAAGILEDIEITSSPLICMQLAQEDGAICTHRTISRDGQIVTAGSDHASRSFAKEIISAIQKNN